MTNRAGRILVLICSLQLALPQGWCCQLIASAAKSVAETATSEATCHSCCHRNAVPEPTEKPTEPSKGDCSCTARDTLLPDTVKQINADFFVYLPVPGNVTPITAIAADTAEFDHSLPTCPLHVIHCLWLC